MFLLANSQAIDRLCLMLLATDQEERGLGVRGGESRGAEDERMVSKQVWRKNHGGS